MKLKKISDQVGTEATTPNTEAPAGETGRKLSRRDFLRNSGIMAGGGVLALSLIHI